MTRRTTLTVFLFAVTACGPSAADEALAEEEEELRKSLVGYYSRHYDWTPQVNPEQTGVGVFHLSQNGTGRLYKHTCDDNKGENDTFEWFVERDKESDTRAVNMLFESGTVMTWAIPDPCTRSSWSLLERSDSSRHEGAFYPGEACAPTIGPPGIEGMRDCSFETCGGVSPLCGGGE